MEPSASPFLSLMDNKGLPYLSANVSAFDSLPVTPTLSTSKNICTFLDDRIHISKKASSIFSSELTDRDDVIIAVLSLLLILAIESILATVLLHSRKEGISNLGFSIRHFVELARDFRFRNLVRGQRKTAGPRTRTLNRRLFVISLLVLLVMLGLEVLVLILSNPHVRDVTTRNATFQLVQVVNPDWNKVRKHSSTNLDRPCRDVTMEGVDGGETTVVPCMSSTVSSLQYEPFDVVTDPVEVVIISDIHEFGVEHSVSIGNTSASYSARAYFSPSTREWSMLKHREQFFDQTEQLALMHKQLVAFMFNLYARETHDSSMGIERLEGIDFNFTVRNGPVIDIIKLNDKNLRRHRQAVSVRHMTTFQGIVPGGVAALRFASVIFRAGLAIEVSGPDLTTLDRSNGNTFESEVLLWQEEARALNWLSLSLLLCSALSVLAALRLILRPVGTAEMARLVVKLEQAHQL